MFDQTLLDSSASKAPARRALLLAPLLEVILGTALVLVPMMQIPALPTTPWTVGDFVPAPPPAPAPAAPVHAPSRLPRVTLQALLATPPVIPKGVARVPPRPLPPAEPVGVTGVIGSVPGVPNGIPGGLAGPIDMERASPPPPGPARPPRRIKVGGMVEAARLIFGPQPEYPLLATVARVQGTVRLDAVIATDGTIRNLRVLSGHPLLVDAARNAVARWRYQPTLLNGEPVEVETEIDVNFVLGE
jgi:periplasmic protein TonB